MQKEYLSTKTFNDKQFFYLDFGKETHGRISFRLWVNRKLVKRDNENKPYIEFPISNAKIIKTEKGNLVLRPSEGWNTFDLFVECGYRGSSAIEILQPEDAEKYTYSIYRSPLGSLGVSEGKLVCAKADKVIFRWKKTGRLYGKPSRGITVCYLDGREEELDGLPDGLEAVQELEKELE